MPLKWAWKKNPYKHNYFTSLKLGINALPGEIVAQTGKLKQRLKAGKTVLVEDEALHESDLIEASQKLREPQSRAHELLLVHDQPRKEKKIMNRMCENLQASAALPETPSFPTLIHPLALFWFVPAPGPEAAPRPDWKDLGLVEAGSKADRDLDIVFEDA